MKKLFSLFALLALSLISTAQSFYDINTIQTIELTFEESNWDALLDAEKAGDGDYIMAQSVLINGLEYDSVGVKYKGNSTYNANQVKNPFHIELDTYKDHEHDGYTDIKLSNVAKDPSFLREVLSYQILRDYMDAPLSNYANVYVNGDLIGLYSNSESVSKKFVNSRFGSNDNTFIKCNPVDGAGPGSNELPDLVYLGQDSGDYDEAYELKSDFGWEDLINLCDTLENHIGDIEEILDVDRALWMLAFDNILVNLDSYIGGFKQNYYLYRDDNDRFVPVVWDLNESFGTFSMTGSGNLNNTTSKQQMSHLLHENDEDFPLISQLLSNPSYKKMYLAHCKTILEDHFANDDQYVAAAEALQDIIAADVQADDNKFYTYNNFISNLNSDIGGGGPGPGGMSVPGITNLMDGRYSYLMNQDDFEATQPTIDDIQISIETPTVGEPITVTATILNENTAFLGYRSEPNTPFQKVELLDDGMHNDGSANDGVFGAEMPIESNLVEYYLYAENDDIGAFSPTNAEHEFYSVSATNVVIGDIVINEFMASNDATAIDQDGEYDDWIELYNRGDETVELDGYHLSDDESELGIFTFPEGAILQADDYLVVWADKDLDQTGFHADFKLSASGESIYLSDSEFTLLDAITFNEQTTDISFGRSPNGTGTFQFMEPTFAAENDVPLGIEEAVNQDGTMKLYPNPTQENFTIELSGFETTTQEILVYDLQGKTVFQGSVRDTIIIDASDWTAGFYVVTAGSLRTKLVVY
ncbi:CotH kinase family protein [Cryomorphaceae bacterium 1068]|nr:CotH kinase family protein [Cryomorphaceae bacterium 1068]